MTMLSAQPITLTGEQHQTLWAIAKEVRSRADRLQIVFPCSQAKTIAALRLAADAIEGTLIAAHDAAPLATVSSGEAA